MRRSTGFLQLIRWVPLAALIAACESTTEPADPSHRPVAKPPIGRMLRSHGQIAYGRDDATTGEPHVFIVSPDGTGGASARRSLSRSSSGLVPDGGRLVICLAALLGACDQTTDPTPGENGTDAFAPMATRVHITKARNLGCSSAPALLTLPPERSRQCES